MPKIKQDVASAKGLLVVPVTPAPRAVPVPPSSPGTATSAAATSPSVKPLAGAPGVAQGYTITSADVGRTSIQLGGRVYNLNEHLGRVIETSDVGHRLTDMYTSDGWVLGLA